MIESPTLAANLKELISEGMAAHCTDAELEQLQRLLESSPSLDHVVVDEDARRIDIFNQTGDMAETFIKAAHLGDIIAAPAEIEGWRERLKSVPLPAVFRPEGIARKGQCTVLKAERKAFSDRLCGTLVAGRRLNRADRRFVAGQIRFA